MTLSLTPLTLNSIEVADGPPVGPVPALEPLVPLLPSAPFAPVGPVAPAGSVAPVAPLAPLAPPPPTKVMLRTAGWSLLSKETLTPLPMFGVMRKPLVCRPVQPALHSGCRIDANIIPAVIDSDASPARGGPGVSCPPSRNIFRRSEPQFLVGNMPVSAMQKFTTR